MNEFTTKLSNCTLTKVQDNTDHYYFVGNEYYVSLTHVLDIGAPVPAGLTEWLRKTDAEESQERFESAGIRGTKLHRALEDLAIGMELYAEDFPTTFEKDAITTFIRVFQFLFPTGFPKETHIEAMVADIKRKVGGTMDFVSIADKRKLDLLCKPTYTLILDKDGRLQPKVPLTGRVQPVKFILDYKFANRSSYNHKVQVSKYRYMFNQSYKKEKRASRGYIWRYSPKHKFGFEMSEAKLPESSFNRIYDTAIEFMGGYPAPPKIKLFADKFRLFELKEQNHD